MDLSKSVMSFLYHIKVFFLSVHLSQVFIVYALICLTFIYCYQYIFFFAWAIVVESFIFWGALFKSLAALMQKLSSPIFVFAVSFSTWVVLGLNIHSFVMCRIGPKPTCVEWAPTSTQGN